MNYKEKYFFIFKKIVYWSKIERIDWVTAEPEGGGGPQIIFPFDNFV